MHLHLYVHAVVATEAAKNSSWNSVQASKNFVDLRATGGTVCARFAHQGQSAAVLTNVAPPRREAAFVAGTGQRAGACVLALIMVGRTTCFCTARAPRIVALQPRTPSSPVVPAP